MNKIRVGFAICGSFCTFKTAVEQIKQLADKEYELFPIMSEIAYATDTRFGMAADFVRQIENLCGKKIIKSVPEAEPIGPKSMFDILAVAPCTGNTLAKLANGITDSSVTMAVKAHIRNAKPVVIAVSTNDGLGASAKNIGALLNMRNFYFVPMRQDDFTGKPRSVVADFSLLEPTILSALRGEQIQPVLV